MTAGGLLLGTSSVAPLVSHSFLSPASPSSPGWSPHNSSSQICFTLPLSTPEIVVSPIAVIASCAYLLLQRDCKKVMDLKSNLDAPLLDRPSEKSTATDVEEASAIRIHESYACVAPKILLEVMTARALMVVLAITYLTFALAFLFDVRSTVLGYRNNNREATALPCDNYNISTAHDAISINSEFGCTLYSTTSQPIWIGQFIKLDSIISVSLDVEIRNVSATTVDDMKSGVFEYNALLYGCYEESSCTDWIEVLQMKNEGIDVVDSYDSEEELLRVTLIGNTFQNQESLPSRGVVKSYFVIVRYTIEGVETMPALGNFEYKFENIDKQPNVAADALTVIMQFFTICFTAWYCNMLYLSSGETEVLPEQYWVIFYLIALICFQNPIYCVICWIEDPGAVAVYAYYVLDSLSQVSFYVIWLLFADGLKRKSLKFYLYAPKFLFGVLIFISSVVVLTYQFPTLSPSMDRNPILAVNNWSGDTKRVLVGFCVMFLFLLWAWTIWWFFSLYYTGQALKKLRYMDSRYLQLSFRFFSLQATLVTLYYVAQYFVIIYFILSRSSEGWINDLNSVADTINTLFRQQTQSFGKICFLTVYGIILAIFFIPVGWFQYEGHPGLDATYVVREDEVFPLRKHRKKIIRAMGKIGSTLTKAKPDVMCLDIAIELMELSYEAYYDPSGQHTESGFGIMNLERHGYILLDSKYYTELDTVCYVCRNISKGRVVVMFRGTASKKHWNSNLDYGKIDIDIANDFKLNDLDKRDGLNLDAVDFDDTGGSMTSSDSESEQGFNDRRKMSGVFESTMSKAGAGVSRAATFVGAASSNAYDFTVGATANVMLRTAHQTPLLKNALACSVHRGFWIAYTSVREFIHDVLRRELSLNPGDVYFTGHSLGGALATLAAVDFSIHSKQRINAYLRWAHWRYAPSIPHSDYVDMFDITFREHRRNHEKEPSHDVIRPFQVRVGMYNFGSPRVGNGNFALVFDREISNAFRVAVDGDIVTGIPPKTARYKHVGTTVVIDGSGSGSVIIDPSFVERRLQFSSKNSVKAHYLTYYRTGLSGAKKASEEIRERVLRKRSRQQIGGKKNIFLHLSKPDWHSAASANTAENALTATVIANDSHRGPDSQDDGEYVKQMEGILSVEPQFKNKSIFQSVKSLVWSDEADVELGENNGLSLDDPENRSAKRIRLKTMSP